MKHYMDILAMKEKYTGICAPGDMIELQEKVDGANFSFRYDAETDSVKAFSRKNELSASNTLRGAYDFVLRLDKDLVKSVLGTQYILFGEWLVKHTVVYPDEAYCKMYAFDVWDAENERWMPQDFAKEVSAALGVTYVPVFYIGPFVSWEHIHSFVGQTRLGGDHGEGVVVKNLTRLNDPDNHLPFYTKIVGEKFRESKGHRDGKVIDPAKIAAREAAMALTETIVTMARVEKTLHKFVDEGILPEDWDEKDMKTIAKNLPGAIYYDCVKEESDVVEAVGELFGKMCGSVAMKLARTILSSR